MLQIEPQQLDLEVIQVHVVLWLICAMAALIALIYLFVLCDAVVSAKSMVAPATQFSLEPLIDGDGPRVLVVYLPGILARSEDQMLVLKAAMRDGLAKQPADLLRVDYAGERFNVLVTEDAVYSKVRLLEPEYERIVFIGASLGGRLLNAIYGWIWPQDPLFSKTARPIVLDAPMDRHDFAVGGDLIAAILRAFPVGRAVNRLRLTDRMAQPPQNKNIGNMAHFASISGGEAQTYQEYIDWVKIWSMKGLSGHHFSVWRDQIVAMATMEWHAEAFRAHPPLYISSSRLDVDRWTFAEDVLPDVKDANGDIPVLRPVNNTVKQPRAVSEWSMRAPGLQHWVVASAHCAFMERPVAWRLAIATALREVL